MSQKMMSVDDKFGRVVQASDRLSLAAYVVSPRAFFAGSNFPAGNVYVSFINVCSNTNK